MKYISHVWKFKSAELLKHQFLLNNSSQTKNDFFSVMLLKYVFKVIVLRVPTSGGMVVMRGLGVIGVMMIG